MSDWRREKADLWATLRGDWWYFAGAFFVRYTMPTTNATYGNIDSGGVTQNVSAILQTSGLGQSLGSITFVAGDDETHVYITYANEEEYTAVFWQGAVKFLREMSAHARHFRREAIGPTAEEVIETYYRRRAKGVKVTMTQLAKEFDFNPNYLRTVKGAYDKAGKWGSKSKVASVHLPVLGDDAPSDTSDTT